MRTLIVVCLLVLAPVDAAAWSPGPYSFEHCVETFDAAVRGTVTKVDVVDKRAGSWVLARATVDVERVYHGIAPAPKQLAFYFWSATDNTLTIAHKLAAKDRILVFLSTNLDVVKGLKTDPAVKHMLQFAKANHRGYLYSVIPDQHGNDTVADAVFDSDAKLVLTLPAAEALLAKRAQLTRYDGVLLDDNSSPHCGDLMVWTVLHFDFSKNPRPPSAPKVDPKRTPVAVPCAELSRSRYDKGAGNAGVLTKGKKYSVYVGPYGTGQWGEKTFAFPAVRIDDAP
jgi:hypothetical protein